jgi:hypothetical protein
MSLSPGELAQRENLRGVHAGQFDWTPAAGGRITGTLEESATRASCAPNPSASASASAVTWRAS